MLIIQNLSNGVDVIVILFFPLIFVSMGIYKKKS